MNPTDLQYLLVIRLLGVKLDLKNKMQSVFVYKMAIMNPVAVTTFFHIICNAIFMSLLAIGQLDGGFLRPISNYFATVETNGHGMLHLHCFVFLRDPSHLAMLRS